MNAWYTDVIKALFEPTDTVCVTQIVEGGAVTHFFNTRDMFLTEKAFDYFKEQNQTASIYVALNPFKDELRGKDKGRTEENVAKIKRLYADADDNGIEAFNKLKTSTTLPQPHIVFETSPGKYQFIWNVDGLDQPTAKRMLKAIASELGTDPAVAETARVFRLPGFINRKKKYIGEPVVKLVGDILNRAPYRAEDFKLNLSGVSEAAKPKAEEWLNEPFIHGQLDNQIVRLIGHYVTSKNISDADEMYALVTAKMETNGCIDRDGKTPYQYNDARVRELCQLKTKNWKTGEEQKQEAISEALADSAKIGEQAKEVAQTLPPVQPPTLIMSSVQQQPVPDVTKWREQFRSVGEMEDGPIIEVIKGVLQEGTCFVGASPSSGKTLVCLAMAKAICTGEPLFGLSQFSVPEPRPVIYLIPESRDRAFRKRCESFRIPDDKSKFMCRTTSAGPIMALTDPFLIQAVKELKPVVFLDTAARFMRTNDENSSAQNQALVNEVLAIQQAGAILVVLVHHATKASANEAMTLENMLRGTSDFAAMCDQVYGIKKDLGLYAHGNGPMEIDLASLKDREQIGELTTIRLAASKKTDPGCIIPTFSIIDETGNFHVVCDSETIKRTLDSLLAMVERDPRISIKALAQAVGLSEYSVHIQLNQLGWHRVQGGKGGASPWHNDEGKPCPYAKQEEPKKSKTPGIKEAVAFLSKLLEGTHPEAEFVDEKEVYQQADKLGISDALLAKARKRLGVIIGEDKGWTLPADEDAATEARLEQQREQQREQQKATRAA